MEGSWEPPISSWPVRRTGNNLDSWLAWHFLTLTQDPISKRALHILSHCHELSLRPLVASKGTNMVKQVPHLTVALPPARILRSVRTESLQKHAVDFLWPSLINVVLVFLCPHRPLGTHTGTLLICGTADDTSGLYGPDARSH